MKTLRIFARYAVWWAAIAAIVVVLDGTVRWVIAALLIVAGVGKCIFDVRRQRAMSRAARWWAEMEAAELLAELSPEWEPDLDPDPEPEPPSWNLALLVDADQDSGILRPSLRISGPRTPTQASVHLNVIDGRGDIRLTTMRRYACPQIETDLVLGTLALPEGVSADEAAGWNWDVLLRESGEELVRRCGPLAGAGRLNDEGELEAPDLPVAEGVDPDAGERFHRRHRPPDVPALNALAIAAFLLHGGEFVELDDYPIDLAAAAFISRRLTRRYLALPIGWRDGRLLVAMADPGNPAALDDLRIMTGNEIHPVAATPDAIVRAIARIAVDAA